MIRGVHSMFYSSEADAMRSFLRDKLELPFTDVGDGWLIFDIAESEMGCHPSGDPPQGAPTGTHHISFYCDDIQGTVAKLKQRGVEFTGQVENHGYGLVTQFKMPGGFDVQLYQPLYQMKRQAAVKAKAPAKAPVKKKASKPKKKPATKKKSIAKKKARR